MATSVFLYYNPASNALSRVSQPIQSASLNFTEQQVVSLVNGSRAYNYDLELENIAFTHYAFRSGGSAGANQTANWIKEQFESFGLEAWLEPFEYTTWDLSAKPSLIIDDDGNQGTTNDQTMISSFQCEHFSWPTPEVGAFADLVILPLPTAANRGEIGSRPINTTEWNAINTSGKIVLIGREVRWSYSWELTFKNKLTAQKPAAVLYTWWYSWMSFTPPMYSSSGGRPLSSLGQYYWNLGIPVGFADYEDGLWIRNREGIMDVSANVSIRSVIGTGTHYNVVGKINGYRNPEKMVIISGHYDTVMCSGFCDNGAGTAGVIELAKVFSEALEQGFYTPNNTLLFIAFASEELGLVGSSEYVIQHKSEMSNITAVLNLDCIGSDDFRVTPTNSVNGLDLDQSIMDAAQDLGITAELEAPGGSDQESFLNPPEPDITPVESSALLIAFPLLYSDLWNMGTAGWIHTAYDNSTSTTTLNWVEAEDLGNHVKITALTVIRIVPNAIVENITITVPDDYPTIQQAINAASPGDTIYVHNGTYYEHITISKSLTLVGESNNDVIVNGTSNDIVVYVSANNVTIRQFTIATTEWVNNYCLYLNKSCYTNIFDNKFATIGWPITLAYSHENTIAFNTFEGGYHWHSIELYNSNDNMIAGNIQQQTADVGLNIVGGSGNFVALNNFTYNMASAMAIYGSHNNIIMKNNLIGSSGGLCIEDCNGTRIIHNYLEGEPTSPEYDVVVSNCFHTIWDAGYPQGGNYWRWLSGTDVYSGPYQNETGSDGIMDSPYIIDENNVDDYPLMQPYQPSLNDVGVMANINLSKTAIWHGSNIGISVKTVNYGVQEENFNVTIYANATIIFSQNITLPSKSILTFVVNWNTTDFVKGYYTITTYAFPVLGETETLDNTYDYGPVRVTIIADVDRSGKVDMRDIGAICNRFGATPTSPKWDINHDVNDDGTINMRDIGIACSNFAKT